MKTTDEALAATRMRIAAKQRRRLIRRTMVGTLAAMIIIGTVVSFSVRRTGPREVSTASETVTEPPVSSLTAASTVPPPPATADGSLPGTTISDPPAGPPSAAVPQGTAATDKTTSQSPRTTTSRNLVNPTATVTTSPPAGSVATTSPTPTTPATSTSAPASTAPPTTALVACKPTDFQTQFFLPINNQRPVGTVVAISFDILSIIDHDCRFTDTGPFTVNVRDANGDVVYAMQDDPSPPRLVIAGTLLLGNSYVQWDPTCATKPANSSCTPVGVGDYVITVDAYSQHVSAAVQITPANP